MSDYEKLCEQFGLSPGSEEDSDRLVEIMLHGGGKRPPNATDYLEECTTQAPLFATFREAGEWSKNHGGKPFTRSADGHHFTPLRIDRDEPVASNLSQDSRAEVLAFLEGKAAPGSDWLPGTCPDDSLENSKESKELWKRDGLMHQRYFLPRLSALVPRMALRVRRGNYDGFGGGHLMGPGTLQSLSLDQVRELLGLAEGKLARTTCWYTTQKAIFEGENSLKRRKRYQNLISRIDPTRKPVEHRIRRETTPPELSFWQQAVEEVRQEYVRRIEATANHSSASSGPHRTPDATT